MTPASAAADPEHWSDLHPPLPEPILMPPGLAARLPPFAVDLPRCGGHAFDVSFPASLLPPGSQALLLSSRPPSGSSPECYMQSAAREQWMPLAAGLLPALCRPLGRPLATLPSPEVGWFAS